MLYFLPVNRLIARVGACKGITGIVPRSVKAAVNDVKRPSRFEQQRVEAELGSATGTIEREAALTMVAGHSPGSRRLTLGADKAYDVHEFVDDLRDLNVTPHIAQNTTNRTSAIDARDTPPRLRHQPAETQASRGTIRLGQDDRRTRPARCCAASRRRGACVNAVTVVVLATAFSAAISSSVAELSSSSNCSSI
jgi:hypothetical protein